MKEITLSNGTTVRIKSVTLAQTDAWIEAIGASDRSAGRKLVVDAMNNADPGSMDLDSFNHTMTPRDLTALVQAVLEVSGLSPTPGEAPANG